MTDLIIRLRDWADETYVLQTNELPAVRSDMALAADEIERLRAALQMTVMLKRLGGMLPGTHDMVQIAVAEAEEALKEPT